MKISKKKIDIAMAQKNLNQTVLSNMVGISRTNLSSLVNGKNCMPSTVYKIAKALDLDVTEIIEAEK